MGNLEPFNFTMIFPDGPYPLTVIPVSINENHSAFTIEMEGAGMGTIVRTGDKWHGEPDCKFNADEVQMIGATIMLTRSCLW